MTSEGQTYHPRRPEKAIPERSEMLEVLRSQKYMTLAMALNHEPYLATVNYAYDEGENCFYFHCSPAGKKADYLKANPNVWGQVLEDRGYLQGECDHAYHTVQFQGRAEVLIGEDEKRRALVQLIEAQEEDPGPRKERLLGERDLSRVNLVRVRVLAMTGKRNPVEK